jgi:hypothetical protein
MDTQPITHQTTAQSIAKAQCQRTTTWSISSSASVWSGWKLTTTLRTALAAVMLMAVEDEVAKRRD